MGFHTMDSLYLSPSHVNYFKLLILSLLFYPFTFGRDDTALFVIFYGIVFAFLPNLCH
jgi:hypothetical protein